MAIRYDTQVKMLTGGAPKTQPHQDPHMGASLVSRNRSGGCGRSASPIPANY